VLPPRPPLLPERRSLLVVAARVVCLIPILWVCGMILDDE
jgi:hypothetical protein